MVPNDLAPAARGLLLSLAWIREHLREFSIGPVSDASFSKDDVAKLKPLSELALTLSVLRKCGVDVAFLDEAAAWAWEDCAGGDAIVRLLLVRPDFLPCCALYVALTELGFKSTHVEQTITTIGRTDMARSLPLQPWSRLALDYNLAKLGVIEPSRIRTHDLYALSKPEPWVVSAEIAYAVTHEVMYLTDFGSRNLPDPAATEWLDTWMPYWGRSFQRDGDWDVLGELAMVSACISRPSEALAVVLAHQQPDGSVVGPDGAGSYLFGPTDTLDRRRFLGAYHTTLVFAMACGLTLRMAARISEDSRPVPLKLTRFRGHPTVGASSPRSGSPHVEPQAAISARVPG